GSGDDGVGPALLAPRDHASHGDVLSRVKGKRITQRGRNLHGHARGIVGNALDGGDFQWMEVKHVHSSDTFEIFERFETGAAAMQRLARRGAEFADAFGIDRVTAGTAHGPSLS